MISKAVKSILVSALVLGASSSFAFTNLNCSDGFHSVQLDTSTKAAVFNGFTNYGIGSDEAFTCEPTSNVTNPFVASVDYYNCATSSAAYTASVVTSYGVVSMQLFTKTGVLFFNGGCVVQ